MLHGRLLGASATNCHLEFRLEYQLNRHAIFLPANHLHSTSDKNWKQSVCDKQTVQQHVLDDNHNNQSIVIIIINQQSQQGRVVAFVCLSHCRNTVCFPLFISWDPLPSLPKCTIVKTTTSLFLDGELNIRDANCDLQLEKYNFYSKIECHSHHQMENSTSETQSVIYNVKATFYNL